MSRLSAGPAAVHRQGLSGNGRAAGKKQHRLGDLFGFDHAFEQAVLNSLVFSRIWPGFGPRCAHQPRSDRIDPHIRCQGMGQGPGQVDQRALARPVGNAATGDAKARYRCSTDDRSLAALRYSAAARAQRNAPIRLVCRIFDQKSSVMASRLS